MAVARKKKSYWIFMVVSESALLAKSPYFATELPPSPKNAVIDKGF